MSNCQHTTGSNTMSNGGSMINSVVQQKAGENLLIYTDAERIKAIQRFYQTLKNQFYTDEQSSKNKILLKFDIKHLGMSDPEEIESGEYYKLAIGLFYFLNDKRESIWFRDENTMINIQREKMSGSIYFSPFFDDQAMIYLGKRKIISRTYNTSHTINVTESILYCFLTEGQKTMFYATENQFQRLKLIHDFSFGLLKPLSLNTVSKQESLNTKTVNPFLGDLILSGKLSDQKIECLDGEVNVSRAFLSIYSEYFLYLFSNSVFNSQKSYVLEFEKHQVENYVYYLCKQFDKINFMEESLYDIQFASFIQDKGYMQFIYDHIPSEEIDQKDQLEIVTLYQSFGFQFI